MQTISILVEGRTFYLKVRKTTTCDDVIQYMLNYNGLKENDKDPYILIVSDNTTEKQLSRNASIQKLDTELKLEPNKIHFIMRKKTSIYMPKISIAKRRCLREKSLTTDKKVENDPSTPLDTSKYTQVRKASEQIRRVKQLYELVRVQKRHLSEMYQSLNGTAKFIKQTIRKKSIQSDDLDTSLDEFLKDVNKENMEGFLNFCDVVATKELENLSSVINDALMLDDELPSRVHGEGSFVKMVLPPSRRNYSFSDVDISTLSCESVGMSCDCRKTPCATFTRDYVTIFGYSPEFE
ncbi:hypothetical protein ACJMK2_021092 [Sinanodonta woodiana]|uniref:Ras-associating domain-containing protein n=1 Tax=Sinanodonta woodiana TaxID=1069815 RepID=A0ABD3U1J9_SINWO